MKIKIKKIKLRDVPVVVFAFKPKVTEYFIYEGLLWRVHSIRHTAIHGHPYLLAKRINSQGEVKTLELMFCENEGVVLDFLVGETE